MRRDCICRGWYRDILVNNEVAWVAPRGGLDRCQCHSVGKTDPPDDIVARGLSLYALTGRVGDTCRFIIIRYV